MKKLIKKIFFVGFGELGSRFLNFIITIILIRFFTVEDYGLISIAMAIYGYAVLLSVHWFNQYGIKKISSGEGDDFVLGLTSIRLSLAMIAIVCIVFYSLFAPVQYKLKALLFYVGISLIPSAFFLDWYFQAKENLSPVAKGKLLIAFSYLLILIPVIYYKQNVTFVGIAFLLANFIVSVFFIFQFKKFSNQNLKFIISKDWYHILKESLPLSFASVISQLNVNLPILLIGVLLSATDVGLFSAAYKLIFFLLIVDRFYYSIYFPTFTRIYKFSNKNAANYFNVILKITLIFTIFVLLISSIFSSEFINIIYGSSYKDANTIFQILLIYFLLTVINSVFGFSIIAAGEEKYYSKLVVFSVLLNLILLLSLITSIGKLGAAISIVLVELFVLLSLLVRLKRFVEFKIKKYITQVIIIFLITGYVMIYFKNFNPLFSIVLGIIIYIGGIVIFRLFKKEDLILLKEEL